MQTATGVHHADHASKGGDQKCISVSDRYLNEETAAVVHRQISIKYDNCAHHFQNLFGYLTRNTKTT